MDKQQTVIETNKLVDSKQHQVGPTSNHENQMWDDWLIPKYPDPLSQVPSRQRSPYSQEQFDFTKPVSHNLHKILQIVCFIVRCSPGGQQTPVPTVRSGTVWYSAVRCGTVQYGMLQYVQYVQIVRYVQYVQYVQ